MAIEFVTAANPSVEEGDTLYLTVRVLDRGGESVPGAAVRLAAIDTAYVAVDSARLGVIGRKAYANARVVAISGDLHSDPFSIRVLAAADSLGPEGATVDTVAAGDSASIPLGVLVLDTHTTPSQPTGLSGRPVTITLVDPAFTSLASATAVLGNDSLAQTALTGVTGDVAFTVKRKGPTQPDSVVVQAAAVRGNGAALAGSPVRFVVRFQ